jgi:hypothetical protein
MLLPSCATTENRSNIVSKGTDVVICLEYVQISDHAGHLVVKTEHIDNEPVGERGQLMKLDELLVVSEAQCDHLQRLVEDTLGSKQLDIDSLGSRQIGLIIVNGREHRFELVDLSGFIRVLKEYGWK